jgi:hypothetical protein
LRELNQEEENFCSDQPNTNCYHNMLSIALHPKPQQLRIVLPKHANASKSHRERNCFATLLFGRKCSFITASIVLRRIDEKSGRSILKLRLRFSYGFPLAQDSPLQGEFLRGGDASPHMH